MILQNFLNSYKNKKIAFIGVGVSHMQAILKFAQLGAKVQALDKKPVVADLVQNFEKLGVELRTGTDYLEDLDADLYFRTPGLPFKSKIIQRIRAANKIVTSELELFFKLCPCQTIGITGSDGKTTTTTIIYKILKQAGRTVHLGGNIGKPLLLYVDDMNKEDIVVVELSSFQLESMRISPDIAVITNLTPNHLNVHKTMQNYVDAKKNIIAHQDAFSKAVLNQKDEYTHYFSQIARGQVVTFGLNQAMVYVKEGVLYNSKNQAIITVDETKLRGSHNIENYLAAIAATEDIVEPEDIATVAKEFNGVEHRIEFCEEINGVKFFNDSIATTPNRAIVGISVFKEPIVLIAGGSDKGLPFDELGDEIAKKVKCVVLLGTTANSIKHAITESKYFNKNKTKIELVTTIKDAVEAATRNAKSGDVVLLAPACASFDMFNNFEERGKAFKFEVQNIKNGGR
ncbi:MAG: UDP-N-acetylmuramoyl-L-alanine--D-glutamate ligase [Oscillospiraceae bacterium]